MLEERIQYGYISRENLEKGFVPYLWSYTYSEARSDAKEESPTERPYYIIEKAEHYENNNNSEAL